MPLAIRINASADRILRTTEIPNYNAPYTIFQWVYPVALPSNNTSDTIFSFNANSTTANYDTLAIRGLTSTQVLRVDVDDGASNTTQDGSTDLSINTWYIVALVRRSATDLRVYLSVAGGQFAQEGSTNTRDVSGRSTAATRMEWGARTSSNTDPMDGRLSNLIVWERALEVDELNLHRRFYAPQISDRIHAHWPLWGSTDLWDYSGNARVWTVGGALTQEDGPPIEAWDSPSLKLARYPPQFQIPKAPGMAAILWKPAVPVTTRTRTITPVTASLVVKKIRTITPVTASILVKRTRTITPVTTSLLIKRTRTISTVTASIAFNLYPRDEDYQNQWFEYGGIDIDGVRIAYLITVHSLAHSTLGGYPHEWSDPTNPHVSFRFTIYLDNGGREEISRIDFEEPGSAVLVQDALNFAVNMPLRLLAIYPSGDIDLEVDYLYLDGTDEPE